MIAPATAAKLKQAIIIVVGAHSLILGVVMLFAPARALTLSGWPATGNLFFASQSGIFLIILGIAYLAALRHDVFVWLILGSKLAAVLFLFSHAIFGHAPSAVALAGAGDAGFALLLGAAVILERRARQASEDE